PTRADYTPRWRRWRWPVAWLPGAAAATEPSRRTGRWWHRGVAHGQGGCTLRDPTRVSSPLRYRARARLLLGRAGRGRRRLPRCLLRGPGGRTLRRHALRLFPGLRP